MAWTDKMVEDLKKMWKQGLTTNEIAKNLGVSKNSIVGKVHRLNLTARPSPIKKKEDADSSNKSVATPANTESGTPVVKTAKKAAADTVAADIKPAGFEKTVKCYYIVWPVRWQNTRRPSC